MEYAPDGDLSKVIKKWQMQRRPMPEDLIWKLFIQVARGLLALHQMKILHRDIKASGPSRTSRQANTPVVLAWFCFDQLRRSLGEVLGVFLLLWLCWS
jgi:serine/threonine protein kinase